MRVFNQNGIILIKSLFGPEFILVDRALTLLKVIVLYNFVFLVRRRVNWSQVPGTSFFAVEGIDGETLVGKLDRAGFAVASGSACSSANPEPSHTLLAMGVAPEIARGALRVSLGRNTTLDEVRGFLGAFARLVKELRNLTALVA